MTDQTTDEQTTDETQEAPAGTDGGQGAGEGHETNVNEPEAANGDVPNSDDEPETFPAEYVRKLRDESARYRQRAADRDALAQRLHTALVAATGRLADPSDLPYADEHLADENALSAAVDDLLARKPHLASRKPSGDVGQGAQGDTGDVDLAGMLRRLA